VVQGTTGTFSRTTTGNGVDASYEKTENATEGTDKTYGGSESGNSITGVYTSTESAVSTYWLTQTGSDAAGSFSLSGSGTFGSTTTETGNTVTGAYTRTITGTDTYALAEQGTNPGGGFSETVNGTESFTLSETGNAATQTFTRSIIGGGSYSRTNSGDGATLPSDSGSTSYDFEETANARAALFSQIGTGITRYTLLEHFNDVSNTGNGNTPGNMNFLPFGQPFVDPNTIRVSNGRVWWVSGDGSYILLGSYIERPGQGAAVGLTAAFGGGEVSFASLDLKQAKSPRYFRKQVGAGRVRTGPWTLGRVGGADRLGFASSPPP